MVVLITAVHQAIAMVKTTTAISIVIRVVAHGVSIQLEIMFASSVKYPVMRVAVAPMDAPTVTTIMEFMTATTANARMAMTQTGIISATTTVALARALKSKKSS